MATIHSGTQGVIYVGSTDEVLNIRSFSIEETQETIDATTMDVNGVAFRTTRPTFKSWSGSFDVYWTTEDDANGDTKDALAFTQPSNTEVVLHFWPTGDDEVGDIEYTGNAYITGRTISSSVDGMIEMSLTVAGTGAITTANKA